MTRDRDIERVLERWFAEGPTQMPDRLFDVVDHIDRFPQRHRARLVTRFVAMNQNLRFAVAAVAVLVVAGAGAAFLTRPASVGTEPSPTPSAAPSASSPSATVPLALQSKWTSIGTRTVPGRPPGWTGLIIDPTSFLELNDGPDAVRNAASPAGVDTISLRLEITTWGCHVDDAATYSFVLSDAGDTLTLTPVDDACSGRSTVLAGAWARTNCGGDPYSWCLGNLEPGRHTSARFNPLSSSSTDYTYGQLSYTVPAGWSNSEDQPGNYTLGRPSDQAGTAIYMFGEVVPHSQGDESCSEKAALGVDRTPEAFATWLGRLPGLESTQPVAVTIGGRNGFMVDVSLVPDWTQTCPYSEGDPIVSTFTDSDPGPGFDWHVGGDARARYIFLDQPGGTSLLIDIEAPDKVTWDAFVQEAMPVVDSILFNP